MRVSVADVWTIARIRAEQERRMPPRISPAPSAPARPTPAPPIKEAAPIAVVPPPPVLIADMVAWFAYEMGLRAADIVGGSPAPSLFRARAAVAWTASTLLGRSQTQIGRALGGRDHTTIFGQLRRARELRLDDPAFRMVTDKACRHFQGEKA